MVASSVILVEGFEENVPRTDATSHDVVAGLASALAAVGLVAGAQTSTLTAEQHRQAVVEVYALAAAVQAASAHLVRTLDARPEAVAGAPRERVAQWFLTERVRLSRAQAAADVAAAWALDPDGSGFLAGQSPLDKAAGVDPGVTPRSVAGRPVAPLPMLGQALANGFVHSAHVHAAISALRRVPTAALRLRVTGTDGRTQVGAVDEFVARTAMEHCPRAADRVADQLLEALGVNPKDPDPGDQYERRELTWSSDRTGMLRLRGQLPPTEGLLFKAAIESFMTHPDPRSTAPEGADATEQPALFPDRRTLAQRRADAVIAWVHATLHPTGCTCGHPSGATVTRAGAVAAVKVHVVATTAQLDAALRAHPVAVDADGCVLGPPAAAPPRGSSVGNDPTTTAATAAAGYAVDGWGDPLGHGVLARLLCDADLQTVTVSEGRRVLDLGRTVRLATAKQRAALIARDRGCVMPGCTAPLSRCEAHHVTWWRHGGATDLENLALCCPAHHAAIHTGTWVLQMRDGIPHVIPPRWVDPTQTPRRNSLFDDESNARHLGTQLRLAMGSRDTPRTE